MSAATTQKLAKQLFDVYCATYKYQYKRDPNVNRYRDKWGMVDVIESVGFDRGKELIAYYFKINKPGHPINHFFYNFDKMNVAYEAMLADKERTARLLADSKERVLSST